MVKDFQDRGFTEDVHSSTGNISDEVKDQYKTRKDAVKETISNKDKSESWTDTAKKMSEDLTSNKDDLKMKQAEAGKYGSNDPHFMERKV